MGISVNLEFIIELQPGNYSSLDGTLGDLVRSLEDKLSGELNHTVGAVTHAAYGVTISPD